MMGKSKTGIGRWDLTVRFLDWRSGGDADEELVRRIGGLFRGLVCRMGGGEDVDDIVQESWLRLMEKRDLYVERSPVECWLAALCRGVAVDMYRRRGLSLRMSDRGRVGVDVEDYEIRWLEVRDYLEVAVGDLSARVCELRWLRGLKHKDVALALGMTSSASRSRLMRARRVLVKDGLSDFLR